MEMESVIETERGGREDKRERLHLRCSLSLSLSLMFFFLSFESFSLTPHLSLFLSLSMLCWGVFGSHRLSGRKETHLLHHSWLSHLQGELKGEGEWRDHNEKECVRWWGRTKKKRGGKGKCEEGGKDWERNGDMGTEVEEIEIDDYSKEGVERG